MKDIPENFLKDDLGDHKLWQLSLLLSSVGDLPKKDLEDIFASIEIEYRELLPLYNDIETKLELLKDMRRIVVNQLRKHRGTL